jgi:putative transposase
MTEVGGQRTEKPKYDPAIHHRRSIRLRGHDYSGRGIYFVTILTKNRRRLFGTVVNGRMALSEAGRIAARCWQEIPAHFPNASLDAWVVMPDHVHGILMIHKDGHGGTIPGEGRPCGTARTIGSMVRGFKIGVTKALGESPWHRNYHEMIIRNERALESVRAYIRNNPAQWDVLRFGEPRFFAGNRALLGLPLTAYLASRGADVGSSYQVGKGSQVGKGGQGGKGGKGEKFFALTGEGDALTGEGDALTGAGDALTGGTLTHAGCVISGFLSPMEREALDVCLAEGIPAVQVLARGLPQWFPAPVRLAMDAGRFLAMTPFEASVERLSAERAAWCNQYVLHLAPRVVIGQLAPDGMLACLLADLQDSKPVQVLSKMENE